MHPSVFEAPSAVVEKYIEHLFSGKWTVEDVLEMYLDELSTAGSVGSGTDRPLGTSKPSEDEYLQKIRKMYSEYLSKTKKESQLSTAKSFIEDVLPNCSEAVSKRFLSQFRK